MKIDGTLKQVARHEEHQAQELIATWRANTMGTYYFGTYKLTNEDVVGAEVYRALPPMVNLCLSSSLLSSLFMDVFRGYKQL